MINLFDLMANLSRQFPNIQEILRSRGRVLAGPTFGPIVASAEDRKSSEVVFNDVQICPMKEGKPVLRDIAFQAEVLGKPLLLWVILDRVSLRLWTCSIVFMILRRAISMVQDIRQVSLVSLRSHMGIVLQDRNLFTIASDVAMRSRNTH